MKRPLGLAFAFIAGLSAHMAFSATIRPAVSEFDDRGQMLHAHGACLLKVGNTFYRFGENARKFPGCAFGCFTAANCYSSTDLQNWKFERAILTPQPSGLLSGDNLAYSVCVQYCSSTQQYVLIMVLDNTNVDDGKFVVATCSTVNGSYTVRGSFYGANNRKVRDMAFYKDPDGKGYLLYYSQTNDAVNIDELSGDFLSIKSNAASIPGTREAPCLTKRRGMYYLYTSGQSGWGANQGMYQTASSIAGPWSSLKTFGDASTYNSQGRSIFPVEGTHDTTYIYVGDRWYVNGTYESSLYIWLPIKFGANNTMSMDWYDVWYINPATGIWSTSADQTPPSAPSNLSATVVNDSRIDLSWSAAVDNESAISKYLIYRNGSKIGECIATTYRDSTLAEQTTYQYQVSAVNGASLEGAKSNQASATTPVDTRKPTIVQVRTSGNSQVIVAFSEPVEQAGAQTVANYGIAFSGGPLSISGASLGSDLKTVTLTTSTMTKGTSYTLTVNGIRDRAQTPNTIAANTQVTFTYTGGLSRIRFYPRSTFAYRMTGGVFEGTNGDKSTGLYSVLVTITSDPPDGQWSEVSIGNDIGYRYVRYRSPVNGFCNVSEIEYYRGSEKATGTVYGTAGSWNNSGNDYTKVFDGNTSTFMDYSQADGGNVGMDLQNGSTANRPWALLQKQGAWRLIRQGRGYVLDMPARTSSDAVVSIFNSQGKLIRDYFHPLYGIINGRVYIAFHDKGMSLSQGHYFVRIVHNGISLMQSLAIVSE